MILVFQALELARFFTLPEVQYALRFRLDLSGSARSSV